MELGVHYIDFLPGDPAALGPTMVATAQAAEQAGATLFTLADHFFQMEGMGRAEDPFLEGYTSLGFLAGQTETITLTMLVTGVTYRYPGLLAKTVTTRDVLSQGRSMLGIGAAWYEREHLGLGVLQRLLEHLEALAGSDDNGPYQGRHYRLAETLCVPQPIRRPPVLIGGGGEKKTLRLVAQYADEWNISFESVQQVAHKIEVLSRHCADVGRDPAEIRKTVGVFVHDSDNDAILSTAEQLAPLGVGLINVGPWPGNPDPVGFVRRLGDELIPRLSQVA
jgi:F420-dependent oxidoreductase-like protein